MISEIAINKNYYLEAVNETHLVDITHHLNNPNVEEYMLRLPSPYFKEDAINFHNSCLTTNLKHQKIMQFHIMNSDDKAIGGIGLQGKYGIENTTDEIGYWLAESYWNKGIMTIALKSFESFVTQNYGLQKLEAVIFKNNLASQHLAQKIGFINQGLINDGLQKKDQKIDAYLYSKLYI